MHLPGSRIKEARLAAGYSSQKAAADEFQVSLRTWAAYEGGEVEPGTVLLRELGEKIGKPLWWFFAEDSEPGLVGSVDDAVISHLDFMSMLARQQELLASNSQDTRRIIAVAEKNQALLEKQQLLLEKQQEDNSRLTDLVTSQHQEICRLTGAIEFRSRQQDKQEQKIAALLAEVEALKKRPTRSPSQQLHQSPANPGRAGER